MSESDVERVVPALFLFVLIACGWLAAGIAGQLWARRRIRDRDGARTSRWIGVSMLSAVSSLLFPKPAEATDSAPGGSAPRDENQLLDGLLAGSLVANAGFVAFQTRKRIIQLRTKRFGHGANHAAQSDVNTNDVPTPMPSWKILVRVLGAPAAETREGEPIEFGRGKALELLVWMAEHRQSSTRSAARTALWDGNVRDSTFSNVVSETRRALGSVVPLVDDEWIARTFSDELRLHPDVITDVELLKICIENFVTNPAGSCTDLAQALGRVRNLPFAGANYVWADAEGITTSHVICVVRAAVLLSEFAIETRENDLLFMATELGLRVLPGHEELVSLRMKGHARNGNRTAIKYEWESYARAIEADQWAGAVPSPHLEQLAKELSRS